MKCKARQEAALAHLIRHVCRHKGGHVRQLAGGGGEHLQDAAAHDVGADVNANVARYKALDFALQHGVIKHETLGGGHDDAARLR